MHKRYVIKAGAWRTALRALATAALVALAGCSAGNRGVVAPPDGGGKQLTAIERRIEAQHARARARLANQPTREELIARHRAFAHVRSVAPEAYDILAQAGFATPATVSVPQGKHTSIPLPWTVDSAYQYSGPGDAGYIAASSDVEFVPGPGFGDDSAQLVPGGSTFPDNFSYIIYRFDDITQTPATLEMYLNGAPSGEAGIALYNWNYGSKGRWEPVFYGDVSAGMVSAPLDQTPGASWVNASNNLAFAVFAINPNVLDIAAFTMYDVPANNPPFADLFASPGSGPAPLLTTLDASGSFDFDFDDSITNYTFDPGDGTGTVDNGTTPTLDHTYLLPGPYTASVTVMDEGGLTGTAQTSVIVSPLVYDEIEDDDDMASAQQFPNAIPFSNFSGGCGIDGNNDGDDDDWFKFDASAGDKISLQCLYSAVDADFQITLWDSGGIPLAYAYEPTDYLNYTLPADGTYYIEVYSFFGASDYYINIGDDYEEPFFPSEFEDNDDGAQANDLWDLEFGNTMTTWIGNLGGPDGHNYDGDNDDWSMFGQSTPVVEGATITLELTYDNLLGVMNMRLYDANANELAVSQDGDGDEVITHVVQPGEAQPYFVKLHCGGGYGDYNLAGNIDIPNPGFDEDENNDDYASANDIGPVPLPQPFTGNVGQGGTYDGDGVDYFTYQANSGDLVEFTVTPVTPPQFGGFYANLQDGDGNYLGGSSVDVNGVVTCKAMILGNTPLPLILEVGNWEFGSPTDYQIECSLGSFDEVEDNDNNAQANPLPPITIPFFSGNLGSGGGNDNDGDNVDLFWFGSQQGYTPQFYIHYDTTNAPQPSFTALIKDNDGDVLGLGSDDGSGLITLQTDNPISPADTYPYYVQLLCVGPPGTHADYWFSGQTEP